MRAITIGWGLTTLLIAAACGHGASSRTAPTGLEQSAELGAQETTQAGARARTASVRAGTPRVVGTTHPSVVRDAVDDRDAQVLACWRGLAWRLHETQTVSVLGLAERLVMSWNIQADGAMTGLRRTGGTIDNRDLDRCVIEALQSVRFPRNETGNVVHVEYTYELISD